MATIANIANKVTSGVNVLGTGSQGSESILKNTTSLWFTKKGFEYSPSTDFDLDYIQQLQQEKKLFILKGVAELTSSPEEDVKETREDGTIVVMRKGLASFNAKFYRGFEYIKALNSLNSLGSFDVSFVDSEGNILGTESVNSSLKGFSLGMLNFDGNVMATNSASMNQGLSFQFIDKSEMDADNFFISNGELGGFKPNKVDGVNEVVLALTTPANLATTIVFNAKVKQGRGALTGLALANLIVTKDGATITPTAISETNGVYTLTISALATGNVITLSLADGNASAIIFGGEVYQSNTASATAIA